MTEVQIRIAGRSSLKELLESPVIFVRSSVPFGKPADFVQPVKRPNEATQARHIGGDGIGEPHKVLFPASGLVHSWQRILSRPPGLQNIGNTCFLNSVIQALMHIPSLVIFLMSSQHSDACRLNRCIFCRMEQHAKKAYPTSNTHKQSSFKPELTQHIRQIGKQFRPGRQEDAHEFLLLLIEQLQVACLQGQPKTLDHRSKETTVVHRVFGGHLRQQVICSHCKVPSNTYEATLALSIDCCSTIEEGLSRLTSMETLSGRNRYRCEKCKALRDAQKQTTIFHAPNTLILHLKRFEYAAKSRKVSRHVAVRQHLDISKYMAGDHTAQYRLRALVVHEGSGMSSGHYVAFALGSNDVWTEFNDSFVSQIGVEKVLKQQAYMLFYTKESPPRSSGEAKKDVHKSEARPESTKRKMPFVTVDTPDTFEAMTGLHSGSAAIKSDRKKHRIFSQMKGKGI